MTRRATRHLYGNQDRLSADRYPGQPGSKASHTRKTSDITEHPNKGKIVKIFEKYNANTVINLPNYLLDISCKRIYCLIQKKTFINNYQPLELVKLKFCSTI